MSEQRTELEQLGEFGLIDLLTKDLPIYNAETLVGVGDDAAVLDIGNGLCQVVSTDLLVEGVHFDLTYMPLKHLGYKAVAVNVSDICAMNATPKQITVSLAVSNRFSLEALQELYAGIKIACADYNVDLVGGDTTSSTSGLFISVTALGVAAKEDICYRSGAKEFDLLVVSGDLGGAYMGLQVLEREKEVFKTAFEINQKSILRMASARGKYIDQWQSLNLFFAAQEDPAWIAEVHAEAFRDEGIRALYYIYTMASESAMAAKNTECVACS